MQNPEQVITLKLTRREAADLAAAAYCYANDHRPEKLSPNLDPVIRESFAALTVRLDELSHAISVLLNAH